MSSRLNVRIPQSLRAKLEQAAADEGKNLSQYVNDHLADLIKQGYDISFAEEGTKVVRLGREPSVTHIGERLKSVIADAVETKLYLKTLGINLSDDQGPPAWMRPYLPNIAGNRPQTLYQPPSEPKKDIMQTVAELKALESLDRKETDPEIKAMIKDLKDALVEALKKPMESPRSTIKQRLDELKEYAITMKIFGSEKEGKQADAIFRKELEGIRTDLHKAELSAVKRESEWQRDNFQRQIDEIKHAPSQFDQITQISALSHQDPAIKAYLHKKLGITEKGEMTPEKLKGYIESIKVPVGDILKGLYDIVRQRTQAPAEMPPPPVREEPSEEELARRVLPEEQIEEVSEPPPPEPPQQIDPKAVARKMLIQGKPVDEVVSETGLRPEEIRGMKGGLTRSGKIEKEE